jgi:hypothetical protein
MYTPCYGDNLEILRECLNTDKDSKPGARQEGLGI